MRGTLTNAWMRCRVNATFAWSSTAIRLPSRAGLILSSRPIIRCATTFHRKTCAWISLSASATTSRCPYKGPASYWSVKLGGFETLTIWFGVTWIRFQNPEDQRTALFLPRARLRHLRRRRVGATAENQVGERVEK